MTYRVRTPWNDGMSLYGKVGLVAGLLAVAGFALRTTPAGSWFGIAAVLLCGVLFIGYVAREHSALAAVLIAAFAARLVVLVADEALGLFPKVDSDSYHYGAASLAEAWRIGAPVELPSSKTVAAYDVFLAPFYYLFGPERVLARAVNVILSLAALANVYRIGRRVMRKRAALWGVAAFAFVPSVLRLHTENLRDVLILVLATQFVYLYLSRKMFRARWAVPTIAVGVGLFFLRGPTLSVLAGGMILAGLFTLAKIAWHGSNISRPQLLGGGLVASALGGLAVWAVSVSARLQNLLFLDRLTLAELTDFRSDWARGTTSYLGDVTFDSWLHVLGFLPLGAFYFLFTPFPWQIENALSLAAVAENVLLVYPLALLALREVWRRRDQAPAMELVILLLAAVIPYGFVEANVGTAMRHRAQFTWMLFLFAGPVLAREYEEAVWWHRGPR